MHVNLIVRETNQRRECAQKAQQTAFLFLFLATFYTKERRMKTINQDTSMRYTSVAFYGYLFSRITTFINITA